MRIEIIDLKIGNVASIQNMLRHIGFDSVVISCPDASSRPDWLILPGVGAFDHGMQRLRKAGFEGFILERALGTKILGICLGMQMLCENSEEGKETGLGLIPGQFLRFPSYASSSLRIPHMEWNNATFDHPPKFGELFRDSYRFYFVHSFHYHHSDSASVWAFTEYGIRFASAIRRNNTYGVQFHPEKSHKYGMSFFKSLFQLPCFDQE